MSMMLDTRTVLWYLENSKELSAVARTAIEDSVRDARHVRVSAISIIETVCLVEKRKLPPEALERLRSALTDPNFGMFIAALDAGVADALPNIPREIVPDMPTASLRQRPSTRNPRPPSAIRRNRNHLVIASLSALRELRPSNRLSNFRIC
jgi:PIN domain nuclease of toxin-antitoxin system